MVVSSRSTPAVCSELAALAQQLAALAPALTAAITAAATVADIGSPSHIQGTAACMAASICISTGLQLQLKGSDALRVAAAGRLLLLAGRAALLAVASAVRQNPTLPSHLRLNVLLNSQLCGMEGCLALMEACERPDAVAVFAATTAAPNALLPWLAAASDALLRKREASGEA